MADQAKLTGPFVRVRFVVEEFGEDGKSTDRHISFADDVKHSNVKDFFDRCGLAADQLFGRMLGGFRVIALEQPCPNKIQAIKCVRAMTGFGLKEAKDLVEGVFPRVSSFHLFACPAADVDRAIRAFKEAGVTVGELPGVSPTVDLPRLHDHAFR